MAMECNKLGNSTPAPSKTPEPTVTWICMGDYVGDPYLCKISSRYDYPLLPLKYAKMRIKWLG